MQGGFAGNSMMMQQLSMQVQGGKAAGYGRNDAAGYGWYDSRAHDAARRHDAASGMMQQGGIRSRAA